MTIKKTTFPAWYNYFILTLSVYVVLELSLEVILNLASATERILSLIDLGICFIFLFDWIFFFIRADKKGEYAKKRIIDLIASIPFAQALRPLRILRIFRLVRTLRIVKGLKGAIPILRILLKNPARSALTIYSTLTLIIYFYCSIGLYNFEKDLNESISNFGDILWMAFTTLTSVGYGDIYPVTSGGRIFAVVLVVVGMGLFSLMTAEIATFFIRVVSEEKHE